VLRPDGKVVIRTTFRERLDAVVYDYWPTARAADERRFPAKAEVVADFAAAGFAVRADTELSLPVAPNLREYHARSASRPQAKLTALPDTEFEAGLRRLAAAADTRTAHPSPVNERYDVLVLTRAAA